MRALLAAFFSIWFLWSVPQPAQAQFVPATSTPRPSGALLLQTPSPAIDAEKISSPSAQTIQDIEERTSQDITEATSIKKERLVEVLDQHPIQPNWYNFLQQAIRRSVERGLPANIVVLLLLFPVIALFIAFSRHVVGLSGFGVYTPAVLSVAFVSTGIVTGILLFLIILVAATLTHKIVRKLKLQPLPRTALLFWGVSCVILAVLFGAAYLQFNAVLAVSIFPILIIILLTENFMETQLFSSQKATILLTLETLLTAVLCALIIGSEMIQAAVILNPEVTLSSVAIANLIIGKYSGLRLLERLRFRSIIE